MKKIRTSGIDMNFPGYFRAGGRPVEETPK